MTDTEITVGAGRKSHVNEQSVRQLKDYVNTSVSLIWQRQIIFAGALLLTVFYFDARWALVCFAVVQLSEIWDHFTCRNVAAWDGRGEARYRRYLWEIVANTLLSAATISLWVVLVALQQGLGGHFMPLFFLFAASLFAAMNNHQILTALQLRLSIYAITFVYIAVLDIIRYAPPISSFVWLEFFTVLFVMFFILDSSRIFLRLYRENLHQMDVLREEHARTQAAYQAKSQFVATVSHELRTPLTSIKAAIDMVNAGEMGEIPEETGRVLQIAGKNCARLSDLINDLLDLQKLEANEMMFDFERVNVQDFLRDAVEMHQSFGSENGNRFVLNLPPAPLFIEGDAHRLMQVMGNLLSNAVKFSDKGAPVTVSATRIDDRVVISVRDQGVGIPKGSKEKVFGRFSQVDSSDRRRMQGTGLGMSIATTIVAHHGGIIDYTSTPGEGSDFFVELPLLPGQPPAQKEHGAPESAIPSQGLLET